MKNVSLLMVTILDPPHVSQLPSDDAEPPSIAGAFLLAFADFDVTLGADRPHTPVDRGSPSGGLTGRFILERYILLTRC